MTGFLAMPQVDARAAREAAQWLIRLNGHNDQHGQHGQHDQQQRRSGQQQRRGRQAGRPGDEDQQAARPDSATVQAWQAWRAADPVHEAAWQRAELVLHTLGMVPPAIAAPVLGRPAVDRPRRWRRSRAPWNCVRPGRRSKRRCSAPAGRRQ